MSQTRIKCNGCGFPMVWCQCCGESLIADQQTTPMNREDVENRLFGRWDAVLRNLAK